MKTAKEIREFLNSQALQMRVMGINIYCKVGVDKRATGEYKRPYIQLYYHAECSKTGEMEDFSGRKWYLSEFMTKDEIIKTVWLAFETCMKHELLEGFTIQGVALFNPHMDYTHLVKLAKNEPETKRKTLKNIEI